MSERARTGGGAGVVVALVAEARALTPRTVQPARITALADGVALLCLGGMGPAAAGHAAQALVEAGVTALAAFGVAGALEAGLRNGALLCPEWIIDTQGGRFAADAAWRGYLLQRLAAAGLRVAQSATLLGTSAPLLTPAAKAAAGLRHGAAAVDMESAAVAAVAATHGLPFLALRAIVDELEDAIPAGLQDGIDPWGRPRPLRLIAAVARQPALLVRLPALHARMRHATRALRVAARAASPALGWIDAYCEFR